MNRPCTLPLTAALAALALACGAPQDTAQPDGAADPASLRTTAFSASFDGYDSGNWEKANWANGNPFNCGWLPDHVTFSNGSMTLKLDNTPSSGKSYSGGEYRTKDTFSYGRYEVRMKAARGSGTVSSFFTYTGSPWDEIDVEILGKNTSQVQFNYYVNGQGGHERVVDLGFDASAGFHTYAIDWQPSSIRWYVDGVLKHSVSGGTLPSHPQQIMMNLWNGIGVDGWLGSFNYSGPLYASYDSASYSPGSTNPTQYTLSVSRNGAGSGTVSSNPGGISCGSSCSASFNSGTNVTLTASPSSGSTFGGWSGSCSGSSTTCTVSMSAARSVTATFNGGSSSSSSSSSGGSSSSSSSSGGSSSGGGSCKAVSGGQSGNFNTTGAICFTVNARINGWGCSNADGRSVSVNGTAVTCGKLPLPGAAPYTFSFSAGTYPWASFYWW
jgi:endo-1,3-1,4-beta-glycanase ExoK